MDYEAITQQAVLHFRELLYGQLSRAEAMKQAKEKRKGAPVIGLA